MRSRSRPPRLRRPGPHGGVFQRPTLDRDLTVARNLRHAAALRGLEGKTARRRIEAALARLGITGLSERTVRTLSGGEARRVELARALLRKPDLLVFDEAIVALGIESRQAIIDHVQSLCTSEGVVVLWTTHLLNEIRSEDQVVVLHRGRVRAQGSPAGLCRRSGTDNLADAFGQLTSD